MAGLEGRRVVVTGSSRGLGRAFAEALARAGAAVVVNGTDAEAVAEVEAGILAAGGRAVAVVGSVAEESVCAALVDTCVSEFGGIDLMLHNAGIVRDRTLLKMSVDEWDAVIAVHLRGAFLCAREAARAMKEGGGGQILLVTSGSGLAGGFGQANYAAAKEGMLGLLRTCVLELTRLGIRTNALWPIAETDMTQVVMERAGAAAADRGETAPTAAQVGFGQAAEVAEAVLFLAGDEATGFNGQCMTFNGRKTSLWTHPTEQYEHFSERPMTASDLAAWYADKAPLTIHRPKLVR
ncbi:MAG TPA: SDR family NAD(P)-dependent oxidoreductase [Pseudomonadales bacterium]|nr:SDR family NAD(P)-dependent oxidoreductase [Pseudomonadales bacterium]